MILVKQMAILFFIMLVGYVCRKRNIINDEGSRVISGIVVNVANPALILSAGINKDVVIEGKNLLMVSGLSLGVYAFLILSSVIIVRILRLKKSEYGTFKVMTVFSNIGFMGFPLISSVYGSEALLYASFFVIPYNILIYTWGIHAMKKKEETLEDYENCSKVVKENNKKIEWEKIFNIGVIACISTIVIYTGKITVPATVESIIGYLSGLTAPLSMMVIGDSMTKMKIRELILEKKILIFSLLKQILIPLAGVFILKLTGLDNLMLAVCMIMLATPVGSMTAMLAQQYDGEYELASKGVALTTLLSVATIPFVSFLTGL